MSISYKDQQILTNLLLFYSNRQAFVQPINYLMAQNCKIPNHNNNSSPYTNHKNTNQVTPPHHIKITNISQKKLLQQFSQNIQHTQQPQYSSIHNKSNKKQNNHSLATNNNKNNNNRQSIIKQFQLIDLKPQQHKQNDLQCDNVNGSNEQFVKTEYEQQLQQQQQSCRQAVINDHSKNSFVRSLRKINAKKEEENKQSRESLLHKQNLCSRQSIVTFSPLRIDISLPSLCTQQLEQLQQQRKIINDIQNDIQILICKIKANHKTCEEFQDAKYSYNNDKNEKTKGINHKFTKNINFEQFSQNAHIEHNNKSKYESNNKQALKSPNKDHGSVQISQKQHANNNEKINISINKNSKSKSKQKNNHMQKASIKTINTNDQQKKENIKQDKYSDVKINNYSEAYKYIHKTKSSQQHNINSQSSNTAIYQKSGNETHNKQKKQMTIKQKGK